MRIRVSKDGYAVSGDKSLRSFGIGVAVLDENRGEENRWAILLENDERVTKVLSKIEITKPRISLFHDWLYLIVEGVDEEFHYYFELNDFNKIISQIKNDGQIVFGVFDSKRVGIEKIIECDIIL